MRTKLNQIDKAKAAVRLILSINGKIAKMQKERDDIISLFAGEGKQFNTFREFEIFYNKTLKQ